ncbi:hypothetical protein [Tolypothrix sp. NIES-4075]|uniref:hypothetical protein n=1 Tax=Tolypothrix sp. NIES-4075 TaxID=2005459 RepID=UPI00117C5BFD|nr:hypothetical protein [Tolypothrix sp. NIES-4075]
MSTFGDHVRGCSRLSDRKNTLRFPCGYSDVIFGLFWLLSTSSAPDWLMWERLDRDGYSVQRQFNRRSRSTQSEEERKRSLPAQLIIFCDRFYGA